ncbi:hypothetical protein SAMN05661091_5096 [Paenibacillus uliginis N3/975]|uniref:Uncharacterized protein n=1 Tax=Paenibacillus uliginis N3/975 TaxID=1313296 RepID=A0A1X7HR44_9BACL|nr:hypothetical protein [Paenibacillus uliginis]SMF90523.1 hypothetical protein SAMN05661091_5096 [Paenibacillus uliginis N3/975]
MTQEYNARSTAAERQASEGERMDGVDTDIGIITPDDHPFAAGSMNLVSSEETIGAETEEGEASGLNLWANERDDAQWMNDWSGRVETHSMFRRSYE